MLSSTKKKYSRVQVKAIRRLLKDLHEIHSHPVPFVHAEPIDDNLFLWHGNLSGPDQTPFEGGVFHIVIEVPFNYPDSPPSIELSNDIPHPFVQGKTVSMSLLTEEGWSPVYSIQTLLLQLQSFLLDGLEASHINTGHSVTFTQRQTSSWKQVFEEKDQSGEGTLKPEDVRDLLLEVGERKPSVPELALFYRMLMMLPYQAIDFSTFLRILQKKREYRKVVESANRFTCMHPKCKHRPQHPFPAFPAVQDKDFVTTKSPEQMFLEETKCFYSKASFLEPDNATLGVGVSFSRDPRDGSISTMSSPLDLLSLSSFRKQAVKKSADNASTFTHWLPLYINAEHGARAMHLAPRCIGIICRGSHRDFKADFVLTVLPKLMNNLILQVVKGKSHASVKAVDGYVAFHRLFLALVEQYPELRTTIQRRVDDFISDPAKRTKAHVPNLGEFLCMLSVLEEVDMAAVVKCYVEEMLVRDVRWIVTKEPQLAKSQPDPKVDRSRAELSFELSITSYSLILFQKYFLEKVAFSMPNAELTALYDSRHGRGTDAMVSNLIVEFKNIDRMKTYDELYRRLGLPVPEDVCAVLRAAVAESDRRNYHGKRVIQVKSADEFLKEKLRDFRTLASMVDEKLSSKASLAPAKKVKSNVAPTDEELPVLIDDEDTWREMCIERFDVDGPPEEDPTMEPEARPWRQHYLQLNLQEKLSSFNENPDFQAFYEALRLSARHLRKLVYTVTPVTNIKSNYHFLTALLTRLIHLEKLVILKGESNLGLKGCKALCKGLVNNPNSLRVLDLHYTHFVSQCVELLEEGLLASKSLVILNLEGNPITDVGARSIAKVLKEHGNLQELNLGSCMINVNGAISLSGAFYYNKSLKKLRISKNALQAQGFGQVVDKLAYSSTIEVLDCSKTSIPSANSEVRANLTRLLEVNTSLKEVNFFQTGMGWLGEQVLHGLGQNRALEKIDLAETSLGSIGGEGMRRLGWAVAKNKSITELHLDSNSIGICNAIAFFEAVYDTEASIAARRRDEQHRKLTDEEVEEDLRPRGCNLKVLTMSKNQVGVAKERGELALKRFVALSHSLVSLDLSECGLGFCAGSALGAGLEGHPTLKVLLLGKNKLGEHGVKKLCLGLAKNTVLEELDVSSNAVGGRGASALGQLLRAPNSNLRKAVLYGNFVGIEGARFIAAALASNTVLEELDLGMNRIRVKGTVAVAAALAENKCLRVVRLKNNFINDGSAMDLVRAVVSNKDSALEKVALAGNRVKSAILVQCMKMLAEKKVDLDVAQLLRVTEPTRMRNTVYCTPLPKDVTASSIKKVFYDGGCGAVVSVAIHPHRVRSTYDKAMYAFVEFAEPGSVDLALDLGMEKKTCLSGKRIFRVMQAGCKKRS